MKIFLFDGQLFKNVEMDENMKIDDNMKTRDIAVICFPWYMNINENIQPPTVCKATTCNNNDQTLFFNALLMFARSLWRC